MKSNEKTAKKPPAHDVIIAFLRQFASEWQRDVAGKLTKKERDVINGIDRTGALLLVLRDMHIPRKDRSRVADQIRHLVTSGYLTGDAAKLLMAIEGDKGGA
ncbi:MAG: hypothetical protein V1723_03250 [Candidatus Uhrbacteria bacterium]